MSYAIGEIIFGINLTTNNDVTAVFTNSVDLEELDAFLDGECETSYSGSGDSPRYFGVEMDEIDECSNERGSNVIERFTVSEEQKAKYYEKLEAFLENEEYSEGFREFVKKTIPDVWLLWGSS